MVDDVSLDTAHEILLVILFSLHACMVTREKLLLLFLLEGVDFFLLHHVDDFKKGFLHVVELDQVAIDVYIASHLVSVVLIFGGAQTSTDTEDGEQVNVAVLHLWDVGLDEVLELTRRQNSRVVNSGVLIAKLLVNLFSQQGEVLEDKLENVDASLQVLDLVLPLDDVEIG